MAQTLHNQHFFLPKTKPCVADTTKIHDKTFELYLGAEAIGARVGELAEAIGQHYAGQEAPLLLGVLNGAFVFMADLARALPFDAELAFVKLSSYEGMQSSGQVRSAWGLPDGLAGRQVLVVEDIVDTGHTMAALRQQLREQGVASVAIAALLFKKDMLACDVSPDFVGFEIPPHFVVGYGLDYDGLGRSLPSIYKVKS